MKRAYITPSSEVVNLNLESVLCGSDISVMKTSDDIRITGDTGLSNKGGWSSDNWTGDE